MARPTKPSHQRRSLRIDFRVTPDELELILFKASGVTISDYMRKLSLGAKPHIIKATPQRAALIKGLGELGKVGSNINQIAKVLNTQFSAGKPLSVSVELIENALHGITTLSTHLINELTNGA